eukprot:TRINITY_DN2599_c0_g1_i3.p1 TRINITY_DN2599_c0_g1~~TRINITY_DN2599_c0_g1_i3.p1  ORF type:complete len:301 (+),score=77.58 TRINITY_DN2599_c0_g1_i3:195-1097(+)
MKRPRRGLNHAQSCPRQSGNGILRFNSRKDRLSTNSSSTNNHGINNRPRENSLMGSMSSSNDTRIGLKSSIGFDSVVRMPFSGGRTNNNNHNVNIGLPPTPPRSDPSDISLNDNNTRLFQPHYNFINRNSRQNTTNSSSASTGKTSTSTWRLHSLSASFLNDIKTQMDRTDGERITMNNNNNNNTSNSEGSDNSHSNSSDHSGVGTVGYYQRASIHTHNSGSVIRSSRGNNHNNHHYHNLRRGRLMSFDSSSSSLLFEKNHDMTASFRAAYLLDDEEKNIDYASVKRSSAKTKRIQFVNK